MGNIVGIQDSHLGGLFHTFPPHHCDVGPGDGQDARTAPWGRRNGTIGCVWSRDFNHRVTGQEWRQVCAGANGTNTRAATAMRDTKGLVQVQVRNIGTKLTRRGTTDQCIQIGPVEINLAAMLVRDVTNFCYLLLKYTVG